MLPISPRLIELVQ